MKRLSNICYKKLNRLLVNKNPLDFESNDLYNRFDDIEDMKEYNNANLNFNAAIEICLENQFQDLAMYIIILV